MGRYALTATGFRITVSSLVHDTIAADDNVSIVFCVFTGLIK